MQQFQSRDIVQYDSCHTATRMKQERPEHSHYEGIAQDLREKFQSGLLSELLPFPHFVVWKYLLEHGKVKKRPFNPKTHLPAKTNDPATWTYAEKALRALATGKFHGIGFVFSKDDPFTGMDLDHCIEKDGTIAAWAKEIIDEFNTYTEYSPSTDLTKGRAKGGVRMVVEGTTTGGKFGNVEMYSDRHYMTITTRHITGTPAAIESRQNELATLYHNLVPSPPRTQENTRGVVWQRRSGHRNPKEQNRSNWKNRMNRLLPTHCKRNGVTFPGIGTAIRPCGHRQFQG